MSNGAVKMSREEAGSLEFGRLVADRTAQMTLVRRARQASIIRSKNGPGFDAAKFAREAKRSEIIIPVAQNLTMAATTAFADGTWTFANESDRTRVVWSAGIEIHDLLTDNDVAVPDGVLRQLRAEGILRFNFPVGKAINRAYAEFDLGAANVEQDGITTLVAIALAQNNLRERLSKMIIDDEPLGVLEPDQTLTIDFSGLNGDTLEDSQSGLVGSAYLLCQDFPRS